MNSEKMYPVLLLTHGYFGAEMVKSAEMIGGKLKEVYAFGLAPEKSLNDYVEEIKLGLPKQTDRVIVLSDVAGASTSHAALLLSREWEMIAFSGLNLDLLIEADAVRFRHLSWMAIERSLEEKASCCCSNLMKSLREIQG